MLDEDLDEQLSVLELRTEEKVRKPIVQYGISPTAGCQLQSIPADAASELGGQDGTKSTLRVSRRLEDSLEEFVMRRFRHWSTPVSAPAVAGNSPP
jgi:hypothetical protein